MWYQSLKTKFGKWFGKEPKGTPQHIKVESPKGPYKSNRSQVKVNRAHRRKEREVRNTTPVPMRHGRVWVRLNWWTEIGTGCILKVNRKNETALVAFPFRGAHFDKDWKGHNDKGQFKRVHVSGGQGIPKSASVKWYPFSELEFAHR